MKRVLLIIFAVVAFSCGGERNTDQETTTNESDANGSVEDYSGSNITPQVEDSADRLHVVDTVGSAESVNESKESDLDAD